MAGTWVVEGEVMMIGCILKVKPIGFAEGLDVDRGKGLWP